MVKSSRVGWAAMLGGCLALLQGGTAQGQGLIIGGSGGMHRSMAGASTAAGVDALGALYWNPAAISGLARSEVVIGGEGILADTRLGSTIPARAFGPLGPAATLSGSTRSDSGLTLASGVGVVYRPEESPLTYGMGLVTLAGAGVNYPGNPGNPVLAPVGPFNRFVLGPQAATALILGVLPTASFQVSDRLAVGGGPMIDVALTSFDPAFFGPTNDANGDGLSSFPTGSHTRPFWGGGFRVGLTYRVSDHLVAGFSFTSPQWFETWRFNARDEVGNPFAFTTRFSLPTTYSAGLAYTGIDGLTLATDLRWFDYRTTQLLGQPVTQGGANWDSIWAVAVGGRYQLTDRLSVQAGYLYNENPVPENLALFNTQLPALTRHTVSAGAYFQLNESLGLSMAYVHGFENSITGQIFPLAGTSTTLSSEYDSFAFGLHIKFGGPTACRAECAPCAGAVPMAMAQGVPHGHPDRPPGP